MKVESPADYINPPRLEHDINGRPHLVLDDYFVGKATPGEPLPGFQEKSVMNEDPFYDETIHNDTIPSELKAYFFTGKSPPNLLTDYDVIGFNLDHTLVKYNVKPMTELLVRCYLEELVSKKKYPKEVLNFDYERNLGVCLNNAVWDIQNGLILKLTEGKQVSHAVRGFTVVSLQEIQELYGDPPLYSALKWPETNQQLERKVGAHWIMMDNFDKCKLAVISQITHLKDQGLINDLSFTQLAFDLNEIQYVCSFSKAISGEPAKYIQKQPELKSIFATLRSHGKQIFLVSNSDNEHASLLMQATIGKDWENYVDICVHNAKKPLFQKAENPFFKIDKEPIAFGEEYKEMQLVKKKKLVGGNIAALNRYFQDYLTKSNINVCYFGDNIMNDIQPTYEFNQHLIRNGSTARWDTIAIVEEFSQIDTSFQNGKNPELIPHDQRLWGENYFLEQNYSFNSWNKSGLPRNFFMAEIEKYSRYAMPFIKNIRYLLKVRPTEHEQEKQLMKTMGLEKPAKDGEVKLQIYDISNGMAKQMSLPLLGKQIDGIWHTGIVAHGKEYYYGSGISYDLPSKTPFGQPVKSISLGQSSLSESEFLEKLKEMRKDFTGEKYDLFNHNCNHFTDECAKKLVGKGIPEDILGLPKMVLQSPLGGMIKPMMEQIQSGFKLKSNHVFDNSGNIAPLSKKLELSSKLEDSGKKDHYPQSMDQTANLLQSLASNMSFNEAGSPGGAQGLDFLQQAASMASKIQTKNNEQKQETWTAQAQQVENKPKGRTVLIKSIKQLKQLVAKQPKVIVYFWAPWFKSCAKFKPIFLKASAENSDPDLTFCFCDMDKKEKLLTEFGIAPTPMVQAFMNVNKHSKFTEPTQEKLDNMVFGIASKVKEVKDMKELDTLIQTIPGVIISFWAPWCGPTVKFNKLYQETANNFSKNDMITFCSVNTDEVTDISRKFQVNSLPSFVFYYQRNEYSRKQITELGEFVKEVELLQKYTEQGYITPAPGSKNEFQSVEEEDYIPPTNIVEIANKDQLLDLIKQKKAVVIDFWALWCGPCKKLKPHFEKRAAENENEDLVFASVNVDVAPDAAREFKVTKIPQVNFVLSGEDKSKLLGSNFQNFDNELDKLNFLAWGKEPVDEFSEPNQKSQELSQQLPYHQKVLEIKGLAQLQALISENTGVIVDFWASWCGPCLNFKPKYQLKCQQNTNENIIYCSVNLDENNDAANLYKVQSIPQFNFFFKGKEHASFQGADEERFNLMVDDLDNKILQDLHGDLPKEEEIVQKEPKMNEILEIVSLNQLKQLIAEKPAVVIDFWASWCQPCIQFKPVFYKTCEMNVNPKIFFATCQIDKLKDVAVFYDVIGVPDFRFYLAGKEHQKFTGADIKKFTEGIAEINLQTQTSAADHHLLSFKVFSTEKTEPTSFIKPGKLERMIETLKKYSIEEHPGVKFDDEYKDWLDAFDLKKISTDALNELVDMASNEDIKQRCAYFDCLRLLILEENIARSVFAKHWSELVDEMIISYVQKQDLSDTKDKIQQIYLMTCIKFLTNIFQTKWGANLLYGCPQKVCSIVELCSKSFQSGNKKVIQYASGLLINLLSHPGSTKKDNQKAIQGLLVETLMNISQAISAQEIPPALGKGTEENILYALIKCECQILYQNANICQQIEQRYAKVFKERHMVLSQNTPHQRVKDVIQDILSLLSCEAYNSRLDQLD